MYFVYVRITYALVLSSNKKNNLTAIGNITNKETTFLHFKNNDHYCFMIYDDKVDFPKANLSTFLVKSVD
jgi:hypothetical protein